MFTGLIEEMGRVHAVKDGPGCRRLTFEARRVLEDLNTGDSIAVDGACQTVVGIENGRFAVETLAVSLEKTTLGSFRTGRRVNLERSLTPDRRMGGHFVQGHVDGTARTAEVRRAGANVFFSVELPAGLARYCIAQGSIAVDGTSLTIAEMKDCRVMINIIPATWEHTVLADRKAGDAVNIEVDVLARYVERLLHPDAAGMGSGGGLRGGAGPGGEAGSWAGAGGGAEVSTMSEERLRAMGY